MEILAFYVILAFVVAAVAQSRGRSGAAWFILALLISPLFALIAVAVMTNLRHHPRHGMSLEAQVRDKMFEQQFAHLIRAHKPAFSNGLVYDVELNGTRKRFRTKAEAIAYCMTSVGSPAAGPPQLPSY